MSAHATRVAMHSAHEAVVIGAGPAGLAVAYELRRAGVDPVIFERGAAVGGSWRGRHEDLRLNTIRWLSGLPGLPIPRRYGRWLGRDEYVVYLETYARSKAFPIEYGVDVRCIDRLGAAWQIETSGGRRHASHVVVATGPDLVSWIPAWPGMAEFRRELRHVATARRPRDFANRKVLVAGGGNSGVEWSEHLVRCGARSVWLSIRRPPNLLPREVAGFPLHPLAVALRGLPMWLRDVNARLLRRFLLGDLSSYGLPQPRLGPYRTLAETGVTVAIDTGFSSFVRNGLVEVVAEIDRFTADEVILADGVRLRPDAVLVATGYRSGLEPLVGHLGVLRADGRPRVAADDVSSQPGLWFIGYTPAIEGTLRLHGIQARRIAKAIRRERPRNRAGLPGTGPVPLAQP